MINSKDINDLFPPVKRAAIELQRIMKNLGYDIGISSTFRDMESQNYLYAQGRTRSGKIITNAKGGDSFHNYRLAFDIFQNIKGKEYDKNVLNTAGEIGEKLGLQWGGRWIGFEDTPHFQWSDGLEISQLKKGLYPKDKPLPWEIVNENKTDNIKGMIEEITMLIDGKEYVVKRILYNSYNWIMLRSFEQAGYKIDYDPTNGRVSFTKS